MAEKPQPPREDNWEVSRRAFLKGASLTLAVGLSPHAAEIAGGAQTTSEKPDTAHVIGPGKAPLEFTLNGQSVRVEVEPHITLLDLVRNELGLTGAKRVCDRGACGACTMLVDGWAINACSTLAVDAAGKNIVSVEGVAPAGQLSPLQEAFVECDALQCGFCTPGMVVALSSLLARNPSPTRPQIAESIAGNICRCGTYQNIFEAVELAAARGADRARK